MCFPGVELQGWRLLLPLGPRQSRAVSSHHAFQGLASPRRRRRPLSKTSATCSSATTRRCRSSRRSLLSRRAADLDDRCPRQAVRSTGQLRSRSDWRPTFKGKATDVPGDVRSIRTAAWATSPERNHRATRTSSTSGRSSSDGGSGDRQQGHLSAPGPQHAVHRRARHRLHRDLSRASGRSTRRARPRASLSYLSLVGCLASWFSCASHPSTRRARSTRSCQSRIGPGDGRTKTSTRSTASREDEIAFIETHDPSDGRSTSDDDDE